MWNGVILLVLTFMGSMSELSSDLLAVFKRPYTGPEIVVEIIGADMNLRANRFFDYWSKPDIMVTFHHNDVDEQTQVEANTYQPRFLYKTKIPFHKKYGIRFHVMEANFLSGHEVMGRAFIDKEEIAELLESGEPRLLSVGENIGVIMIRLEFLPKQVKQKDKFGRVKVAPLALNAAPKQVTQ